MNYDREITAASDLMILQRELHMIRGVQFRSEI